MLSVDGFSSLQPSMKMLFSFLLDHWEFWTPEGRAQNFVRNRPTGTQIGGRDVVGRGGQCHCSNPTLETRRGHSWPPWAGNSHCRSLWTNYFQSCFKSFTHFNIPAARVVSIHSHSRRLSFPKSANPICHDSDMFLGTEQPYIFKKIQTKWD